MSYPSSGTWRRGSSNFFRLPIGSLMSMSWVISSAAVMVCSSILTFGHKKTDNFTGTRCTLLNEMLPQKISHKEEKRIEKSLTLPLNTPVSPVHQSQFQSSPLSHFLTSLQLLVQLWSKCIKKDIYFFAINLITRKCTIFSNTLQEGLLC